MQGVSARPHLPHSAFRLLLGVGCGLVLALALPHAWPWEARALLGWVTFCAVNLLRLFRLLDFSAEQTRTAATREDETRAVAATTTTVASLVSLIGVMLTLHLAGQSKGLTQYLLTGLSVLTVALSWLLIHSEYTLHYARRFYRDDAGVQFLQPGKSDPLPEPSYLEFAYLSFTIGMTFQVSDTSLDTSAMRRLLLGHALLSYLFGAVIVAVTINALAGVVGQ